VRRLDSVLPSLVLVLLAAPAIAAGQAAATPFDALRFRSIGPAAIGGRIHDVESRPDDPSTVYLATATGGIWKSVNAGTTWTPIFEGQAVSTFGDLSLVQASPDVIWAGTGEQNNRQSTSWGNGVYRTTDGGGTWTHLGLEGTHHIGRVRAHPTDANVAFVGALGNLWKPTADRGVYRTRDAGRSWEKVLFVDTLTGIVDLAMSPRDPNVLWAAAYQRLRTTWGFNGGGAGSGIYRTTDGGTTWTELEQGLPAGDKGRIGLAVAPSNERVLYALVEHASEGGVYRSDDAGDTWAKVNTLNPRPMYYSHVFVDPANSQRVYVLGVQMYKSEDGGRTFEQLPLSPTYDVGVKTDHHSMWIDPRDPKHFYLAGDGGAHVSFDMGRTFQRLNNLPIGQFYAIGADMREPYRIYGGMQDNHSWMGPSATRHWLGIVNEDWKQIGFGDGMYHQVDKVDQRAVYSTAQNGEMQRIDPETGDRLDIRPRPPAGEPAYRYDWVTPIVASRHEAGLVYFGGNRLFISRDKGATWTRSKDLTRQVNRDTLPIMGVPGRDIRLSRYDGEQSFSEIVTISESPLDGRVLWVGTDDGNVQLTRDAGATWTELSANIRGVPNGTYVSRLVASAAARGTAYATFDAHRSGDFAPYAFRTTDFGRTWMPITSGLPPSGSVRTIHEFPGAPHVLLLGTEHALFVSTDSARTWARFAANLPTTRYDDILVHPRDRDLILGTHGRSIWVLDDATPLAEWSPRVASAPVHLFRVRAATVFQYWEDFSNRAQGEYAGENPADGAILTYHLARAAQKVTITVTGAGGRTVRTLSGPGAAGTLHRVAWDLRHEPPSGVGGNEVEGGGGAMASRAAAQALPRPTHELGERGPFVSPGTYTVTIDADGARAQRTVEVKADPQLPITLAQHRAREAFLLEVAALQRTVADRLAKPDAPRAPLARIRQGANALAGDFNGRGVRQGSLHPPTTTHRETLAALKAELTKIPQ
jgi:photosystem II stability/assembly factor-like uncharacterized protein